MKFLARVATMVAPFLVFGLSPTASFACACGCNVFDVGTGAMLPTGAGGNAFVEYDFMDQTRNWSGASTAPPPTTPTRKSARTS